MRAVGTPERGAGGVSSGPDSHFPLRDPSHPHAHQGPSHLVRWLEPSPLGTPVVPRRAREQPKLQVRRPRAEGLDSCEALERNRAQRMQINLPNYLSCTAAGGGGSPCPSARVRS